MTGDGPEDAEGDTCPACGEPLFAIVPGKTNRGQIQAFARKSFAWRNNPDAVAGEMHPGLYCRNGCTAILAEHRPLPGEVDYNVYGIFLTDAGPERLKVTSYVRRILGLDGSEALKVIKSDEILLAKGRLGEIEPVWRRLDQLGARYAIRVVGKA